MNQILVTGEEQVERKATQKVKKSNKTLPINGIVIFFAISIIILGICMISGSVYAKEKINKTVEASIKPEISVERNDDDNTIKITVTHIRNIKTVTYRWNDGEEKTIDGENRKNISGTIDLIGGTNTLKVTAIEENGQTSKLEKTYIAGNVPKIEIKSVENGVQVVATSDEKIKNVQYSWDDGEIQKIDVGEKKYEGIINAPKGKHILKIEVVNESGVKASEERTIVGDTEPTLTVQSKLVNGKPTFVIDAEDDENIKTITITHNAGEEQVIEVNAKTYHKEVVMTEEELNTIIVTVTNKNDLQKTRKVRFDNK